MHKTSNPSTTSAIASATKTTTTAATPAAGEQLKSSYLWGRRHQLKVHCMTNRFYYHERQRVFEMRDTGAKALSIVAGSVAFANVSTPLVLQTASAAVAIIGIASLVFGFGNKARDSSSRVAQWAGLEREINLVGEYVFTEEQLNQWYARVTHLEQDEPPANLQLLAFSQSRADAALGTPTQPITKQQLGWLPRWALLIP